MRKILFGVLGCLVAVCAHAAQVANLDYVHKLIQQKWDISIPIKADNPMLAANMKYLLTAVDVANEILNGEKTTDYGNGEFATLHAADTVATIQAVETLVKKDNTEKAFFMTVTPGCFDDFSTIYSFDFSIGAAGEFIVDWGDGTVETITKPDTTYTYYNHDYATDGPYTIKLTGRATAYGTDSVFRVSYDSANLALQAIDGTLGGIFPTLPDGSQPLFKNSFAGAYNITSIPSKLFTGISGAPAGEMFRETFSGCSDLTSIPSKLFAGISGAPASYMFANTFYGCSGLTSIPSDLFAGISGAPASFMFASTFSGCSGLTGSIPSDLFAGISGAPADSMFGGTFQGCSGLTSIPDGLFAGISGAPASAMFSGTFQGCSGLTSIPDGLFAGISGAPAGWMFNSTFYGCSGLTGAIPDGLFGNLTGAPAGSMFSGTFYGCSKLTSIPENLFGNISGTAQTRMFHETFYNCTSLTGPSARINGQYLYEIWPSATSDQVGDMYYRATQLSDYSSIPSTWK